MLPRKRHSRLRHQTLGRYRYVRLRWRILFAVVDFFGAMVFRAAAWLRIRVHRPWGHRSAPPDPRYANPRSILLIQLDHLGDAVITTSMLPALRTRYPNASIGVLAGPWNREVFEAAEEVDFVEVCRVNRFAPKCRWAWIPAIFWWGWRLRRCPIDLGIDVRGEFPLALLLWIAGVRRRLGWDCGGGGFLLTDRARFVAGRPEVESRWALLDALGIGHNHEQPLFQPTQAARRSTAKRLARSANDRPRNRPRIRPRFRPRIVVHVGAGTPAKRWPPGHWRELVERLVSRLGAEVVLVGGRHERSVAREIAANGRFSLEVSDWTGRLSLDELAALVQQAELFVGADSGPAHLAAAVGTPVVVLFSGTNRQAQWQPRGEEVLLISQPVTCSPCHGRTCPRRDHPCMTRIAPCRVEEVITPICRNLWGRQASVHGRAQDGGKIGHARRRRG